MLLFTLRELVQTMCALHLWQRRIVVGVLSEVEGLVEIAQLCQRVAGWGRWPGGTAPGRGIIGSRRLSIELVIDAGKSWQPEAALQEFQHRTVFVQLRGE